MPTTQSLSDLATAAENAQLANSTAAQQTSADQAKLATLQAAIQADLTAQTARNTEEITALQAIAAYATARINALGASAPAPAANPTSAP